MKCYFFLIGLALLCTGILVGCKSGAAPDSPKYTAASWTEDQVIAGIGLNGVIKSGNNLVAGGATVPVPLPYAFIFTSTNDGATWSLRDSLPAVISGPQTSFLMTPSVSFTSYHGYLLAGISQVLEGGIYRSTDNGIDWTKAKINWPTRNSLYLKTASCFCSLQGDIYAGTGDGVFVSTDQGLTWTPDNTGLPDIETGNPAPVLGIATAGSNIFACTGANGIFRSSDGGVSWESVYDSSFLYQGLTSIRTTVYAAAFNSIGNPSTGGVFVSSDGGSSWKSDTALADRSDNVIFADGSYLFVGSDSAIYASTNDGQSWKDISTGYSIGGTSYFAAGESYLFAIYDDTVWRYPLSGVF